MSIHINIAHNSAKRVSHLIIMGRSSDPFTLMVPDDTTRAKAQRFFRKLPSTLSLSIPSGGESNEPIAVKMIYQGHYAGNK